jgi:GTPase SAR1 family protein
MHSGRGKHRKKNHRTRAEQFYVGTPSYSMVGPTEITNLIFSSNKCKFVSKSKNGDSLVIDLSSPHLRRYKMGDLTEGEFLVGKELFLNLSDNRFESFGTIPKHYLPEDKLKSLNLSMNYFTEMDLSSRLSALVELNLSWNKLTEFPSSKALNYLPVLKKLNLNNNEISHIPEDSLQVLAKCGIVLLHVAFNKIAVLPPMISTLISLKSLNLRENQLVELPASIVNLKGLYNPHISFNVAGNKLVMPPQQVADQKGLVSICEYFESVNFEHLQQKDSTLAKSAAGGMASTFRKDEIPGLSNYLRMVVVGHKDAGKSVLVRMLGSLQLSTGSLFSDEQPIVKPTEPHYLDAHIPNQFEIPSAVRKECFKHLDIAHQYQPFDTPVHINVYDFVGTEIYHAISEMFFSERALHLVVWDITKTVSARDCDEYVQYWIDLIQARAPGSSIVIVATHTGDFSEEEVTKRIEMVTNRIKECESFRLQQLREDIAESESPDRTVVLNKLLGARPVVYCDKVARLSLNDASANGLKELIIQIAVLVSPRFATPKNISQPFGIINLTNPYYYRKVREKINSLRCSGHHFCTIRKLYEDMKNEADVASVRFVTYEGTKSAVLYWATVGEVLFFIKLDGSFVVRHTFSFRDNFLPCMRFLICRLCGSQKRRMKTTAIWTCFWMTMARKKALRGREMMPALLCRSWSFKKEKGQ